MSVEIRTGVSADDQERGFMNATLQHNESGEIAYSIATYVVCGQETEQEVADQLRYTLEALSDASKSIGPLVTFEVEIGREGRE